MNDRLKGRMARAMTKILEGYGCKDINVLAALGSFGDTLDDDDVVEMLEDIARGEPPIVEMVVRQTH